MSIHTHQMSRLIATISLMILIGACGSSPPVHYYSLTALETDYSRDAEGSLAIGVGPLRLPDYLERTRIVTRRGDSEVIVDDFNRWAEPVEDAIHRIIATNVDSLLDDVIVVGFPYNHYADMNGQVIGRIDRFDTDENGRVVLLAQWGILTPDSDVIVAPRRSRYEAQATNAADYGAIAAAMSEVIAEFSRDIAREFEAAVP